MPRFLFGHWIRDVVLTFLVVASIESVSLMWVYASEETTPGLRVELAKDQSHKTKFMARLEEMRDFSQEEEHWLSVYTGLDDGIRKADGILREIDGELAKTEHDSRAWERLSRQKKSIGQNVSAWRMLQDPAVRQYALLTELEPIEQSLKRKVLSRAEYVTERAHIMDRIAHVEQLRLWENLAGNITYFLKEIADELADLENAVWMKPR